MSFKNITIAVLGAAVVLSGCAIKPEPLTFGERQDYLSKDVEVQNRHVLPISGPVTLSEAMARTVLSNIDHQVQAMELAMAEGEFERVKLAMLPNLRALGAITHRDPQSASRSVNLDTGEVSTGGWTSSEERTHELGDVTFSWNLLDLGLSYYSAKQQADAVLNRHEMQRSVLQNLLARVRNAYWRAYFAQEFGPQVDKMLARSRKALSDARVIERKRLMPPAESLQYQKSLYSLIGQLEALQSDMELSQIELRNLLNIPANAPLKLVAPGDPKKGFAKIELPEMQDMMDLALDQRPEVRQAMYQSRSSVYEVKKAWLRTLPGLELKAAFNFDTNKYLRDHHWTSLWGTVTANIMDMLTAKTRISAAEKSVDLAEYRRLGMHLAIMMQVQMAAKQFDNAVIANQRSVELGNIDSKLAVIYKDRQAASAGTGLESIRQDVSALFSRLNQYRAYAEAQSAYGRLLTSVGIDLIDESKQEKKLEALTEAFARHNAIDGVSIKEAVARYHEELKADKARRLAEAEAK
ncbi:MAG: TolC family protein [Duodenibacillus sp.]|nr:TolC family protein [Duodenibacillus sp.]